MKFVNRGYIIVSPKEAFIVWANENDSDYSNLEDNEPNVYLIEEDFYDDEAVLKGYFKRIFENELYAVTDKDSKFPPIRWEVFNEWFSVRLGSCTPVSLRSGVGGPARSGRASEGLQGRPPR